MYMYVYCMIWPNLIVAVKIVVLLLKLPVASVVHILLGDFLGKGMQPRLFYSNKSRNLCS